MKILIEESVLRQALEALEGINSICSDSRGVAGYHLNGDIAEWGEFDEMNQMDISITALRTALDAAEKVEEQLTAVTEAYEVANDGKNYANELLAKQSAEIENLRQFHHDQQELHEMNEALHQTNNILRQQLADKHQLFMCASANYDRLAEHLVFANDQITELQRERDELVEALKQFAECDLNDGNCASLEVATRRIRSLAQATLEKLGADKTGEVG